MSGLLDFYILAGYTTPESTDPPDSGDYFIRAEDVTYVESGYWDGGYVLRSLSGITDVEINAGLTATAIAPQIEGTANNISILTGLIGKGARTTKSSSSLSIAAGNTVEGAGVKSASADISGVIVGSVSAKARLTSSIFLDSTVLSSTSANAVFNNNADLIIQTKDRSWNTAGIWGQPVQQWAAILHADASVFRVAEANNIVANGGLASTAETIKPGGATISVVAGVNSIGGQTSQGSVAININTGFAAQGDTELIGTANNIEVNVELSSSAIASQLAYGTLNIAGALLSASGRIRPFVETAPIISTMTVNCARIRPGVVETAAIVAAQTSGNRAVITQTNLAAQAVLSTVGNYSVINTSSILANADVSGLGGKRVGMAFNEYFINAATLNTGSFRIRRDPFFTLKVETETRNHLLDQETRKITTIAENRLNTATAETRVIRNLPETRQYYIDRGTLVGATQKERT